MLAVQQIPGRGRAVVAQAAVAGGSRILECSPLAKVVKAQPDGARACVHCLGPVRRNQRYCCERCEREHAEAGGALLARCDLQPLERIHQTQDRKFPLLVAQLLAALLEGLRTQRSPPDSWREATSLVHAVLPDEVAHQLDEERRMVVSAFVDAGVSTAETLEMLLPPSRYGQLIGAAQLNAFEMHTARGFVVSCILAGSASYFNHSCEPNVFVQGAEDHRATFVATRELLPGEELCISYLKENISSAERREILQYKYGFECKCPRCRGPRSQPVECLHTAVGQPIFTPRRLPPTLFPPRTAAW